MTDGGVLLAKKDQDDTGTEFTNLEEALKDCIDMDVEVMAEQVSLMQNNIGQENIVAGVKVANIDEITKLLKEADTTMIF